MTSSAFILAQGGGLGDMLLWAIVLGGALFVVYLGVMAVRRMALGLHKPPPFVDPVTELTRLYEQGKINKDEYERGRRKALGVSERQLPPPAKG